MQARRTGGPFSFSAFPGIHGTCGNSWEEGEYGKGWAVREIMGAAPMMAESILGHPAVFLDLRVI
jgi:hypothetical protein